MATTKTLSDKSLMELLKDIVVLTEGSESVINKANIRIAREVQKRLGLETATQAVLLAALVEMFDNNHIVLSKLARFFDIRNIDMYSMTKELKFFTDRGYIHESFNSDGSRYYRLSRHVIDALCDGHLPQPRKTTDLDLDEFVEFSLELFELIKGTNNNEDYYEKLCEVINKNTQIPLAARLKSLNLEETELLVFFVLLNANINGNVYSIGLGELHECMHIRMARSVLAAMGEGRHPLVKAGLVEPFCNNGQADMSEWTFTAECCETLLPDVPGAFLKPEDAERVGLMKHEDIIAKELFYSGPVEKKVKQLEELFDEKRMQQVMEHLSKRGMRKCFTCILHGGPGTGKTETVLQLARRTGRDIMMVDLASIRDKFVGESEKRIKRVFDTYRALATKKTLAPILCFNEADAIICKRISGGDQSVDKMENAIQDIILGEMETLEGIMIATTNLADNMDSAFERRFLYKIEFDRPSATARKQIWKSMLPEISDDLALRLADKYDFNGGEMENVSRKFTISSVINCNDDVDETLLFELCDSERYKNDHDSSVGFKVG